MTVIVHIRRTLRHSCLCSHHKPAKISSPLLRYIASLVIVCSIFFLFTRSQPISSTTLASVLRVHSPSDPQPANASLILPKVDVSSPLHQDLTKNVYEPLLSRVDAIVGEGHSAKKVLASVYALPEVVVSNMTQHVATRLYWKLVYTDIVRALRIQTESSSSMQQILHPRATVLFIHAQNGLGNRLRAIASGIALAKNTHRVPVVVWQRDAHLGSLLTDIFNVKSMGSDIHSVLYRDLIVMEDFPSWEQVNSRSTYWQAFNYMQKDGLGAATDKLMRFEPPTDSMSLSEPPSGVPASEAIETVLNAQALPARPAFDAGLIRHHQHIYFKSGYVANVSPLTLNRRVDINKELRSLTPISKITDIVSQFDPQRLRYSYGIHIRSRSLANDNVAVDNHCEYTRIGAYTTDYWRQRSQLSVFVVKINQKLRLRKNATFFVAADDRNLIKQLNTMYPGKIYSVDRNCDDRETECVVYAMADLLCLSKTRRIYGSNWSSFSEVAGRLSNRRLYLSGKDFGRVKKGWVVTRGIKSFPLMAWRWWLTLGDQYGACRSKR